MVKKFELYPHQKECLKAVEDKKNCAFYIDMGLGKTFTGAEQLVTYHNRKNLIICPKSLISMWVEHFKTYYPKMPVHDLSKAKIGECANFTGVGVINYDIVFRRPELLKMTGYTLMLDESSKIMHSNTKRTKFISKLKPKNTILLSGTPCNGKYELLLSQAHMLGWKITKKEYWKKYIDWMLVDYGGIRFQKVTGYKNVDDLMKRLMHYGAVFMKAEDVFQLPATVENTIQIPAIAAYRRLLKRGIVEHEGNTFVGDTPLSKRLYARMLCGGYNKEKLQALEDLLESTDDRVVIFYNFQQDFDKICDLLHKLHKPISYINGGGKDRSAYENEHNAVTLVQYQSGAMGENLQKANILVYFTLPESSDLYTQSKKRIHRIGQERTCFYYYLMCENSIEQRILAALEKGEDYTDALFQRYLAEMT